MPAPAPNEAALAALAAAGDRTAFTEIVRLTQARVRAVLMRLVRDPVRADDLAQETYLRAFEKIETYSGAGSLTGWLCRIAYTEFLKSARKGRARTRLLDAVKAEADEEEAYTPAAPGARVDLDRALAILGEAERACVVMCYAGGLTHSEAAQATGLPLGTVKSHVTRGRDKLRYWFETGARPREDAA